MYLLPTELNQFGIPTPDVQGDILNLVQLASTLIDTACGRIDGDGNGSLVYTTYVQRYLLSTRNRNLVQLNAKPVVSISAQTVSDLQTLAASATADSPNCYYTGVLPSVVNAFDGSLSGIIGASGRYGYTRQDMSMAYPDLFAFINPLNLVTIFGGPAPWVAIDITQTDIDPKTGEVWIPAGLQLQRYSEIMIHYNSGYDVRQMPWAIKFVCASIVKNALAKGDATTAMLSMNITRSGAGATFGPMLLDPTLDAMLQPYKTVRAI
jgi:hypothetical protein